MELISNSASDAFKAHLRSVGASYLIAGEETLDMEIAVRRIGEVFGVDELILGGGGTLNWSMARDGLCDEVSIVMHAAGRRRDRHGLPVRGQRRALESPADRLRAEGRRARSPSSSHDPHPDHRIDHRRGPRHPSGSARWTR